MEDCSFWFLVRVRLRTPIRLLEKELRISECRWQKKSVKQTVAILDKRDKQREVYSQRQRP
jgi:hypothetical protein